MHLTNREKRVEGVGLGEIGGGGYCVILIENYGLSSFVLYTAVSCII